MHTLVLPFPQIDPVLIQIGPLAVRWYALAYIAGILLGWHLATKIVRRPGWLPSKEQIDDLIFYATLGIVLGGRLGYVFFYYPGYFIQNPLEIFTVWNGGMSFHGGLIGVIVAIALFARNQKLPFWEIADIAAIVTPVGLFFGRIANFINGELWGRVSDVPWAMVFPGGGDLPRHPSQLYEAILEGIVLFAVLWYFGSKPREAADRGFLSGLFLLGYGCARSFIELFREPDRDIGFLFGFLTMGQILSLPMMIIGALLMLRSMAKNKANA